MIDPNWKPKPLFDTTGVNQPQTAAKKNTGGLLGGFAKGIASPFEYLLNASILNPTRELAAQFTGNKVALKNARRQSNVDLGLGEKGTDFTGGAKKFAGNSAQALLTVGTGGLNSALAAKGVGTGGRIAADAAIGAGFGGSAELANRDSTLGSVLKQSAIGGATSGALTGAMTGLPKLASKAAPKAMQAADNIAQRALKVNDSEWLTKFANRSGEEAGTFANRFGLVGKKIDTVKSKILQPGYEAYNAGIKSIGDVPKNNVLSTAKAELADYLKSSDSNDKEFAKTVLSKVKELTSKYNGNIPATELNALKTQTAKKVNYKLADSAGAQTNNLYEKVADIFRTTVGKAADSKGISIDPAMLAKGYKSTNISGLGEELNLLEQLAQKADVKGRVGAGKSPLSLTTLVASAPLMAVNPAAAVASGGAVAFANSTAGKKLESSAANKIASSLASMGSKAASNGSLDLATVLGGISPGVNKNQSLSPNNNLIMNTTSQSSSINPSAPNADINSPYSQNGAASSQSQFGDQQQSYNNDPFAPENIQANIQQLVAGGASLKDISSYVSLAKEIQALTPQTNKQLSLSDTAIGRATDYQNAISQLQGLSDTFEKNPVSNPILGKFRGSNPFDTTAQTQQAQINGVRQIVGKALEGGVLRKEDEAKYAKILPTLSDSPQVAKNKIAQVLQLLQSNYDQYISLQQQAGKGAGQYPTMLTATQ